MNTKCCKKCPTAIRVNNKSGLCKIHRELAYRNDPIVNATKKIAQKKCYEAKKIEYISKSREWYQNNKEKKNLTVSAYRVKKADWYRTYQNLYKAANRDRLREMSRISYNHKYQNDLSYFLKKRIRNRTNDVLRNILNNKPCSFTASLGCSGEQLVIYIESQFTVGMSWQNRSQWHIDHVKPLSLYDLGDEAQFKQACHYTNLQPLWAIDNLKKGDKWQG